MEIYRFDRDVGRPIEKYESSSIVYSPITRISDPSSVGFMYIEPKGIVGYHKAPTTQLFLVVQGKGWVRGEDETRIIIEAGEAAFWKSDEGHEAGSETGMTAVIIQADMLDPNSFMPVKTEK